jgi:L-ascorbate metabolism protein UlaG (beta-lactamase superfamily)
MGAGPLRITWMGHSTVLVELDGVRLLTDPVLRPRVLHLRRTGASVDDAALAGVDAVLVSHAHHDHLDVPTLVRLGRSLPVVVPRGAGPLLRRRGFVHVVELSRDEETAVGGLTIRATRADHPGRRSLRVSAAPVGYLVSGSARIYFAGDTGLFEDMRSLGEDLDVALLPVGGWGPTVPAGHLDPQGAADALRLLRPRMAVPIHWGTYRRLDLGRDPAALREPADAFARLAAEVAPDVEVAVLPVGGSVELPVPVAEVCL